MFSNDKVLGYELTAYSMGGNPRFRRGVLCVTLENVGTIPVISPSEEGEPRGAGSLDYQRERGKRYAIQEGVSYIEVNLDLANAVLKERSR